MAWRAGRRGVFEGPPRAWFHRTGARYVDACAAVVALNGVAVAGFGLVTLLLFVDLRAGELAAFAACWAAVFLVEGVAAALMLLRAGAPVRAWLVGTRDDAATAAAWSAAARLPVAAGLRPGLHVLGAAGAVAAALVLASLLGRPVAEAALLLPWAFGLHLSSAVLRRLGLELAMRPVLEAIGERHPPTAAEAGAQSSLHGRMLATVPMVTWGAGVAIAGLVTDDDRGLVTLGGAGVVALAVTAAVSTWLGLVLADAVSGPVADLRDAARRVGDGDLSVRVPVVSTDETGELAAAFNAMVAGLRERERLREAFGAFVDPALTERVLAEGTDLRGEEVEATVLVLDVRGFTAFAEGAAAQDAVASLNALFEAVVPVVLRHGGHATTFVGDGLLAVFGAPDRRPDHAARAVAAARELAARVREGTSGPLRVGVGVNTGRVVVGTIGGGGRRVFTVIGDPVNTAARVEAATRLTGDDVLVTEATVRALGAPAGGFAERPAVRLKGKAAPVRVFAPRG